MKGGLSFILWTVSRIKKKRQAFHNKLSSVQGIHHVWNRSSNIQSIRIFKIEFENNCYEIHSVSRIRPSQKEKEMGSLEVEELINMNNCTGKERKTGMLLVWVGAVVWDGNTIANLSCKCTVWILSQYC